MEFHEYWEMIELIANSDKYESIGQEIVRYKRNMYDSDTSSRDLSESVVLFLQKYMLEFPYPTQKIIYQIINYKEYEKNQVLEEIIFNSILILIELICDDPYQNDKKLKLLNILSNVYISEPRSSKVSEHIAPALYDLKEIKGFLSDVLYISLLSNSSQTSRTILDQYLDYENKKYMERSIINRKIIFLKSYYQHQHWMDMIIGTEDEVLRKYFNIQLFDYVTLYKQILRADKSKSIENFALNIKFDQINTSVLEINTFLKVCIKEIERQHMIGDFLRPYFGVSVVNMSRLTMLTQLLNSIPNTFKIENYEKILKILQMNHQINETQKHLFSKRQNQAIKTEVELFNEYMIVKSYISIIITSNFCSTQTDIPRINDIGNLLKSIEKDISLYHLLETVYLLLFLRYEHMRKSKIKKKICEKFSFLTTRIQQNNNQFMDITETCSNINQNGFVCNKECFEEILISLRFFLKSIGIPEKYVNENTTLKDKFANVLKSIDNTLLRLSVLRSSSKENSLRKKYSSQEWIIYHDDHKVIKNKLMKKYSTTASSRKSYNSSNPGKNDSESEKKFNTHQSVFESIFTELPENQTSSLEMTNIKQCIISQVLMDPESLVKFSLMNKDMSKVNMLINDYHLNGTDIAQEIEIFKFFKKTLKKLYVITVNYEKFYETKWKNDINYEEEIKEVAEAGFEIAKLIEILDSFCNHTSLRNDKEINQLLGINPMLWKYGKEYVKTKYCIDFMISLPSTFELNQNVYKFIIKKIVKENEGGYFMLLLKYLLELQKIFFDERKKVSFDEIFKKVIFTIKPEKFKIEQARYNNLKSIMKLGSSALYDDDNTLLEEELKMKQSESSVNYIERIINYVRSIRMMLKLHTNDIFNINEVLNRLNIEKMIAKIIFVKQYNPEHVTNFAFNCNINLIHSIAIVAAGEYLSDKFVIIEKESLCIIRSTDILYYIKRSSFLLAYLMKEIQNFDYKTLHYDSNMNFFKRMIADENINSLKKFFDDNLILSVLYYNFFDLEIVISRIKHLDSNEKIKILSCITEKNWKRNNIHLNNLKDHYLEILIQMEPKNAISLLNEVGNANKLCQLISKYITLVNDADEAEKLLNGCLCIENVRNIDNRQKMEIKSWITKIKIYRQILKSFKNDNNKHYGWLNIKDLADKNIMILVNYLINIDINLELCYDLLRIHRLQNKSDDFNKIFIEAFNRKELETQHLLLLKILHTLPEKDVFIFFDYSLNHISNLASMRFILNYLSLNSAKNARQNRLRYQKFLISSRIIQKLDQDNKELWSLAEYPLIIIEQLLMNSKMEILNDIIKDLRLHFDEEPISCNVCSNTNINYQDGEILIYEYDGYHKKIWISLNCIDFIIKIYAAKALDFNIIEVNSTNFELPTNMSERKITFQMPNEIPTKDKWIADDDDEAKFCMCCKNSKFSLLNRRHHCRRCGRVICTGCSNRRIILSDVYNDFKVRCCDDCFKILNNEKEEKKNTELESFERRKSADFTTEWKLSGDPSGDQIVRDEFSFEHSPNVALCISIMCLHSINEDLTKFILFHCNRLELLLKPLHGHISPEIDVVLVTKMLKNLAITAKFFGDAVEANSIIDYADMILKIVENDENNINIPKVPYYSCTDKILFRDTISEMIKTENWKLSLEISVKYDRQSTSSIFSSWAATLIKGGYYRLAREKMALALQSINGSSVKSNEELLNMINKNIKLDSYKFNYKRPIRSPPLLFEILEILEITNSKKDIVEGSSKTAGSIEKIKNIIEGDYTKNSRKSDKFDCETRIKSTYFKESLHYLLSFAASADINNFFIKNNMIRQAIRYSLIQNVNTETFIQTIVIPIIRIGKLKDFFNVLNQIDVIYWKKYIAAICKYLEKKKSLNVLHQIHLLTKDFIRASLTCLKLYLNGSGNYSELHEKSRHLMNAKKHLQAELELIEHPRLLEDKKDIEVKLKWDCKKINSQINIILLQIEISKFLANCESEGLSTLELMPKVFMDKISLKTLLGTKTNEANQVAILILICGKSICAGFGLCFRIIQEFNLDQSKIYATCTKYLARDVTRLLEVENLVNCIKTNASSSSNLNYANSETDSLCDELIVLAVEIAYIQYQAAAKTQIDRLIQLIRSKVMKIQCYINSNQLKTAYVLSASMNNEECVRRVMKQAEITRQDNIRRLCEKKLTLDNRLSTSTESSICDLK